MGSTSVVRVGVRLRITALVAVLVAVSAVIWYLRRSEVTVLNVFADAGLNHELGYQLITLGMAGALIALAAVLGGRGTLSYLRLSSVSGEIVPVPWLGIRPKEGETWAQLGTSFLVIITLVTSVVVYLQVARGGTFRFSVTGVLLPALAFAVLNSFTEEVIYRHTVTSVFLEIGLPATAAALTSAALFGGVHYFGTPGGVPGAFLAGFLGWFLSKSIAETRSFAWAWIIHGAQDVVIFIALFGTAA